MKIRFLVLLLFVAKIGFTQSETLDEQKRTNINTITSLFKAKNIDQLAKHINYPLNREYPLLSIQNEADFKQRFSEVFDDKLVALITNSKAEQWEEVGWRGIMLNDGVIWMDSDNGKIKAINYESETERKNRTALIAKDKENLHSSLKTFDNPTLKLKTKKHIIRIDQLANNTYRYASWNITDKESSKPNLVLSDGDYEFQGNGGNYAITFTNGLYTYTIYRNSISKDDEPEATLEVLKNDQIVLTENGKLIY
ncbi:hypothetical protein ADIWIN_1747 [Winogradskyella psychrotolerans RS-3]|uniref:Uncharacterized protein n=1 Tax=Winogradskyella psychrotolerans RS-3 TaxID=641526 RepID=S7VTC8_9FLAO|nr:hypothetical protein [Winogradskyella psychrotolerans]EPR73316.1 hypothetical protein ADIWIN_1747 [Winogradskyella psychrotolerans RS-3]